MNHGYLVPFREIANHIRDQSEARKAVVLIDGYNTDAGPLLAELRDDIACVEIRGERREALALEEIRSDEWTSMWFLRRSHDISPDRMISRLEEALASKYEGRRRFFVPLSPVDRWAFSFLDLEDTSGYHYQLTEFRRLP